jgi:hypothetical protein
VARESARVRFTGADWAREGDAETREWGANWSVIKLITLERDEKPKKWYSHRKYVLNNKFSPIGDPFLKIEKIHFR